MLNIALPKGRLGSDVYKLFAAVGCECPSILEDNRKLIFTNEEAGVRYFWVKPVDVATYVEHGAADIGVVGKDVLMENEPDIYELLDLQRGCCRVVTAAPSGYIENQSLPLRVATKYPHIAAKFYASQNRIIELIRLGGSMELAPLAGLSDVIVDIVETGSTLKENNLQVTEVIATSSARLIANKSAYKFKGEMIDRLVGKIKEILK